MLYHTRGTCTFFICCLPFPFRWQKKKKESWTKVQIYNYRSYICKWFLEIPCDNGQRVINIINPISSVPVQVFTDDAAGTKAMWTEKEAKGNCLLPINQCSALLPRRKGSAGRSMQSDKLMVFWCWHQTCININLLTGLCFPLGRLSTGPNQSSLLRSIKIYDYNTSVHSAAERFWVCWHGIQTKWKRRYCSNSLIIPNEWHYNE